MSLIQKVETWRGSEDSLVDPAPPKRSSQPPQISLPRPLPLDDSKRLSAFGSEVRWRYSTLSTSPVSSYKFENSILPTPAQPILVDNTPEVLNNTTLNQLSEVTTPALSRSSTSLASKDEAQPLTPQSLPSSHPYIARVKPVLMPQEYRSQIKLALKNSVNSTFEPSHSNSDAESLAEVPDYNDHNDLEATSTTARSVIVTRETPRPRRLSRKSDVSVKSPKRADSVSSSGRASDKAGMRSLFGIFRGGSISGNHSTEMLARSSK